MRAVIKKRKRIAQGTIEVTFDLLGNKFNFKPGQIFSITLIDPPYFDQKGARRHFSIVNSPNEKGIIVMATRVRESAFKQSLSRMPLGTKVEIDDGARGDFTLPAQPQKPLVFIAGGIGITPYMSMLHYIDEEKLAFKITLIYSNRNKDSTAYFEELKALEKKNPNLKVVFSMTEDESWKGEKKLTDAALIRQYSGAMANPVYYISGPPEMTEAVKKSLTKAGVDKAYIKSENFYGY